MMLDILKINVPIWGGGLFFIKVKIQLGNRTKYCGMATKHDFLPYT
jgi:hypothetical protein